MEKIRWKILENEDLGTLPTPAACGLQQLLEAPDYLAALWGCCDLVELILRLSTSVLFSQVLTGRENPAERVATILRECNFNYRLPTLGMWKDLVLRLAREDARCEGPLQLMNEGDRRSLEAFFARAPSSQGALPLYESSFTRLRNRLAHGAGLHNWVAKYLLERWRDRIEAFIHSQLAWLKRLDYTGNPGEPNPGRYQLLGLVPTRLEGETTDGDEEVWAERGDRRMRLWPLIVFGIPRVPPQTVSVLAVQVYANQDGNDRNAQIFYTPYLLAQRGSSQDPVYWSQGDDRARIRLAELLKRPEQGPASVETEHATSSFRNEIVGDAARLVGRRRVLRSILRALRQQRGQTFWLHGPAGVGKSSVMAKVAAHLIEHDTALTVVYRFRYADARCNSLTFLRLILRNLFVDPKAAAKAMEGLQDAGLDRDARRIRFLTVLRERLQHLVADGRDVIFVIDGLDEMVSNEPVFVDEVLAPLLQVTYGGPGSATWLVAGRSGASLAMERAGARTLDLGSSGMPGLEPQEIWAMLLDQIGAARKDLFLGITESRKPLAPLEATAEVVDALKRGEATNALLAHIKGPGWAADAEPDHEFPPRAVELKTADGGGAETEWLIDDDDDAVLHSVVAREGDALLRITAVRQECAFIDSIVERSRDPDPDRSEDRGKCLPLYVKFVIDDILRDQIDHTRRGALDASKLPRGLDAYYAHLMNRLGIGLAQSALTYVVYALAVAREEVDLPSLTRLLGGELLLDASDAARQDMIRGALDSLSTVLSQRIQDMRRTWTLYHHGIREFLLDTQDSERARRDMPFIGDARKRWANVCAMAAGNGLETAGPLKDYVARHGTRHLCEVQDFRNALRLWLKLAARDKPDARANAAVLRDQKVELSEVLAAAAAENDIDTRQALARIEPHDLYTFIGHTYETGFNVGAVRVLLDFHPDQWNEVLSMAGPYDLVFRHDVGDALAQIWLDGDDEKKTYWMEHIMELTRSTIDYRREIAGYAFKLIYDQGPRADSRAIVVHYAQGETFTDRMLAGELMITLAVQDKGVAGPRAGDAFWRPYWPYLKCDIDALKVLMAYDVEGLARQSADPALAACAREYLQTEQLRQQLCATPELRDSELLMPLLGSVSEQFKAADLLDDPAAIEAIAGLLEGPAEAAGLDLIRVLASHPMWNVTEEVSSLLRKVVGRRPHLSTSIRTLMDDGLWRVRYCAVDAAFNIGDIDDHRLFHEAFLKCALDAHSRVQGICADDLLGWIRLASVEERRAILRDPQVTGRIAGWLEQATDAWVMEYVYLLFSFLDRNEPGLGLPEIEQLLRGPRSDYFRVETGEFFELAHGEFMRHIDRLRAPRERRAASMTH